MGFSSDGQKLVSVSQDNNVRMWDMKSGKAILYEMLRFKEDQPPMKKGFGLGFARTADD